MTNHYVSFQARTARLQVTLTARAELVRLWRGPLAAAVDEANHHSVFLLRLQVVEPGGEHIKQGGLLLEFLSMLRWPIELHQKASGSDSVAAAVGRHTPSHCDVATFHGTDVNFRLNCWLCSDRGHTVSSGYSHQVIYFCFDCMFVKVWVECLSLQLTKFTVVTAPTRTVCFHDGVWPWFALSSLSRSTQLDTYTIPCRRLQVHQCNELLFTVDWSTNTKRWGGTKRKIFYLYFFSLIFIFVFADRHWSRENIFALPMMEDQESPLSTGLYRSLVEVIGPSPR